MRPKLLLVLKAIAVKDTLTVQKAMEERVLTNCEPASQRVMRVKPASHASHASHHVSQRLVPSLA